LDGAVVRHGMTIQGKRVSGLSFFRSESLEMLYGTPDKLSMCDTASALDKTLRETVIIRDKHVCQPTRSQRRAISKVLPRDKAIGAPAMQSRATGHWSEDLLTWRNPSAGG
jgi:hypothetical protein